MSVDLDEPVLLMDDWVEVTVLDTHDAGDKVGVAGQFFKEITIKPEYQASRYLLMVEASVKNLTSKNLRIAAGMLAMKDQNGAAVEIAGACFKRDDFCGGSIGAKLEPHDTMTAYFVFAAPNELDQFTLILLGVKEWKK